MFSKFSEEAQKVLITAKKEMQDLKHSYVGSEHLFLAFLKVNKEFSTYMKDYNLTYIKYKEKVVNYLGYGNNNDSFFLYTPLLKKIIENAIVMSKDSSSNEVSIIHLICSCLDQDESIALRILDELNIDYTDIQKYYFQKISNKKKNNKKKLIVEEYGVDLNKKALNNLIDPVVGRDKEIKRIMEILCRRSKNNPLLIGDAGVGKTAIIEELARLIVKDQVPSLLKNKRIISVSIASLVAGTKYRGEFEERITKMLKELEDSDDIILFIDEVHTIMGAGGAEGAIDAANILKPALSRGKIRLIGATTLNEYKQSIEKDKAMERRFQTVLINEPNNDEVYNILCTLRPLYEEYHKVKIDDNCLKEIIKLSNKYIFDRKQPDKSIDILDEVSSRVSLRNNNISTKLLTYKEELLDIRNSKNNYLIKQDFNNAFKYKNMEKDIVSKINDIELKSTKIRKKIIKVNDIVEVISDRCMIPIYEINNINKKYITNLNNILRNKIIGQDNAIDELIKVTKRIKCGFKNSDKPVSFLFVGPTGVGKTQLALEYGKYMFNDKIIRLDLSEYKDITSINKIIGSNPGYIGYNDSNKLDDIKNNPNSLILLDEIEKAHPAVLNLFLQILDNGKITDNKGNIINFSNCIIVMTSNIGYDHNSIGFEKIECKSDSKLTQFLSIELLNRIEKVIYFNKMNYNNIYSIVKKKIDNIIGLYKEKNINITIDKKIITKIISDTKYDIYGARKIDKVIEDNIDSVVIDSILNGNKNICIADR